MKTSGFDKKIQEANRIYEQKREFHGQEKPAAYNLLLSNYRGAVSKILSVAQKSKEKKIINTDPYFALIYDTEKKIYHVLSMRTARDYPNQNYKNRISPAIERKCIHKRIKYRSTILLNKCLEDIRMYAEKIGELNQEYIALENKDGETSTLEDVLAENLYHVSFLPLNTPLDGGRVEKSIELKTADIASITWLNSNPKVGKSLDKVCEGLLQEAGSNGLSKVGFAVSENEYGSG